MWYKKSSTRLSYNLHLPLILYGVPILYIGSSPHVPILFAELTRNVVSEQPNNKNGIKRIIWDLKEVKILFNFIRE